MGRIQKMRMEKAKKAFQEEMFPTDKARAFYVDHAGNAMGFKIQREDGFVLSYNGESGRYEPFNVLPLDGAVNLVPYDYQKGKIVDLLSDKPYNAGKHNVCYYARYFCGDFLDTISNQEYQGLRETGELYAHDTMNYEPVFNDKIYPHVSESSSAQISLFGYHYDDDRRTVPSKAEMAAAGLDLNRNTKIEYLYRDADNYKVRNECVIEGTLTQEQKQQILDCRFDGEWFIPHMVGLPEERFGDWDEQSDHPYFELYYHSFEETYLSPTVPVKAEDLVAAFQSCKKAAWEESKMHALAKTTDGRSETLHTGTNSIAPRKPPLNERVQIAEKRHSEKLDSKDKTFEHQKGSDGR